MQLDFGPLSLTEIIVASITFVSSLAVAYYTSKREMKRIVFEERLDIYRKLFVFLRDLKHDYTFRRTSTSLHELTDIEIDIKLLGSRKLIRQLARFRKEFANSLERYDEQKQLNAEEIENERQILIDKGYTAEEISSFINELEEDCTDPDEFLLADEVIDSFAKTIAEEIRANLGVKKNVFWHVKSFLSFLRMKTRKESYGK